MERPRVVLILLIGIAAGYFSSYYYILLTPGIRRGRPTPGKGYSKVIRRIVEHRHESENRTVADELATKVRVLCLVITQPASHETKAKHVKATWGKRCNKLIFMSTQEDLSLPAVKLPVREGYGYLWGKTREAFLYAYEHHKRDADWFMKADDDTYVIVENLRFLLSAYKPSDPTFFGCRFKSELKQGYMSGGAGYVLSRAALDRFVNKGLPSPHLCNPTEEGVEDYEMGLCLERIGVKAMDSRDWLHRGRFFPFTAKDHLIPLRDPKFWYWSYIFYPTEEGLDCCSDFAISFHYIAPDEMYVLDYFIYHLKPYGISNTIAQPTNNKKDRTKEDLEMLIDGTTEQNRANNKGKGRSGSAIAMLLNIQQSIYNREQNDSAVDQLSNDSAVDQPSNDSAVDQPSNDSAVDQLSNDSAVDQPSNDSAVEQPSNDSAVAQPSNDSAVDQPSNDSAVDQPSNNSAGDQPSNDIAVNQPSNDSAVDQPSNDIAVDQPSNDSAVEQPSNDSAVAQLSNDDHLTTVDDDNKQDESKIVPVTQQSNDENKDQTKVGIGSPNDKISIQKSGEKDEGQNVQNRDQNESTLDPLSNDDHLTMMDYDNKLNESKIVHVQKINM